MRETKSRVRQRTFRFDDDVLWKETPEYERRQCVELLAKLLREIVRDEVEGRAEDEREDQQGTP